MHSLPAPPASSAGNLIEELLCRDWEVTALCLPSDNIDWLKQPSVHAVFGNIVDRASLVAAMPDAPDGVFHMAANTSTWSRGDAQQYRDNVFGTELMLDVALQKAAKRFVYTSSISAWGYQPGRCIDESTPSNAMTCGVNHYGKTKYLAERLVRQAVERGLSAVILNPVNILGPHDVNNWTKQLIRPVSEGTLGIVPPGKAMWAYVEDIVDAHIAAVDRGAVGENYLLGGVEASFKEVINETERLLGKPLSTRTASKAVLWLALQAATIKSKFDGKEPFLTVERYSRAVAHISCRYDKAVRDLGFKTTPLRVALEATIRWLTDEHLLVDQRPTGGAIANLRTDAKLGIDYVDVNDEPVHVEWFRNESVRVYMATIAPGTKTLYHRHSENTLYIAIEGGIHHIDTPSSQKQRPVGLPKSLRLATKATWLMRRLAFGTLDLPNSIVLMQYHRGFPVIHQVCASAKNKRPMRLLGVEVFPHAASSDAIALDFSGFPLEFADGELVVYRIRLGAKKLDGPSPRSRTQLAGDDFGQWEFDHRRRRCLGPRIFRRRCSVA